MSFPGKKNGSMHSFGEIKGHAREHEVSHPPKKGPGHCTMADYANIEGGERYGERKMKAKEGMQHHMLKK